MPRKFLLFALVFIFGLLLVVQLLLQYGLSDSVRKHLLPALQAKKGISATIGNMGVNLLTGAITVNDMVLSNPHELPGNLLVLDQLRFKISHLALFQGSMADVKKINVRGADLTITRDRRGTFNIAPLFRDEQVQHAAASDTELLLAPLLPTNINIRLAHADGHLRYLDQEAFDDPLAIDLQFDISMEQVGNVGDKDVLSGNLAANCELLLAAEKTAFELSGQIAPITALTNLSFMLSGAMQETELAAFKQPIQVYARQLSPEAGDQELAVFQDYIREWKINGGRVAANFYLVCKDGMFDPTKSVLRLTFKNLGLNSELPVQIAALSVKFEVSGDLFQPRINFGEVLKETLAKAPGQNEFSVARQSLVEDRRVPGERVPDGNIPAMNTTEAAVE